jgi:nuclear GTP-binding protein
VVAASSATAGETTTIIAPGAENVGHAQIVKELGKPFELAGLFGAADAGVFGDDNGDEAKMEQDGGGGDEMMDDDA